MSLYGLTSKRNFKRNIEDIHVVCDIVLYSSYQIKFSICPISYYVFQVENGVVSEVLEGEVIQNNENQGKAALLLP